jgi:hypothetical protein
MTEDAGSQPSMSFTKRRGAIQEEVLNELTSRAASLDEVDFALADRLIAERLGTMTSLG